MTHVQSLQQEYLSASRRSRMIGTNKRQTPTTSLGVSWGWKGADRQAAHSENETVNDALLGLRALVAKIGHTGDALSRTVSDEMTLQRSHADCPANCRFLLQDPLDLVAERLNLLLV